MKEEHRAKDGDERHNRRLGLGLFALYAALYGIFMLIAAFFPQLMSVRILGRVNVAVTYGFALIFGAFLLSFLYLIFAKKGDT